MPRKTKSSKGKSAKCDHCESQSSDRKGAASGQARLMAIARDWRVQTILTLLSLMLYRVLSGEPLLQPAPWQHKPLNSATEPLRGTGKNAGPAPPAPLSTPPTAASSQ